MSICRAQVMIGHVVKWETEKESIIMESWLQFLLAIFTSICASSGLWAFLEKRAERKDVKTQVLIGLGHDRIMYLGMKYIERGWITRDEYENLYEYLYTPYKMMGGNGSAKRVMDEVNKLEIRNNPPYEKPDRKENSYATE